MLGELPLELDFEALVGFVCGNQELSLKKEKWLEQITDGKCSVCDCELLEGTPTCI